MKPLSIADKVHHQSGKSDVCLGQRTLAPDTRSHYWNGRTEPLLELNSNVNYARIGMSISDRAGTGETHTTCGDLGPMDYFTGSLDFGIDGGRWTCLWTRDLSLGHLHNV